MSGKFTIDTNGNYRVRGAIRPEQIIAEAQSLLMKDLQKREALLKPDDVTDYLKLKLSDRKNEVFAAIFLDNKHRVIEFEEMFRGTIDGAAVYPRVVAQRCLELNAAAVIFAHNHPSGCPEPSQADRSITARLVESLALIEVRVLDHFVIGCGSHVSLAERGWL